MLTKNCLQMIRLYSFFFFSLDIFSALLAWLLMFPTFMVVAWLDLFWMCTSLAVGFL